MSKFKANVVVIFTGSIACYKACNLISSLVKNDYAVKCVATKAALQFIGKATLEALSGNAVLTDMFQYEHNIQHVTMNKWADLFLVCPATANTINKMAGGIADDLPGSLFLANNFKKPFWIVPAMNVGMYENPITQTSMEKLKQLGCYIFDTEEGRLACGDNGKGRLIDTGIVLEKIKEEIK